MFAEFMETYGSQVIGLIITTIGGLFVVAIKRLVKRFLDTKEKRKIARDVVKYVEQCYKDKDMHGQEKLDIALGAAEEMCADSDIPFHPLEMRVYIESALAEFNKAFKEAIEDPEEDPNAPNESETLDVLEEGAGDVTADPNY